MTRKQYNKHKLAIDWFYAEGNNSPILEVVQGDYIETQDPRWKTHDYIINDEFVGFRKALYEGRTVELLGAETEIKLARQYNDKFNPGSMYRIKPEFERGDYIWVWDVVKYKPDYRLAKYQFTDDEGRIVDTNGLIWTNAEKFVGELPNDCE